MAGTDGRQATPGAPPEPAVLEMRSGHPVLMIVFGGIKHGVGFKAPPFEFLRSLSERSCDAVFVRDYHQAWYQFGVEGIAADVAGVAEWARRQRQGYRRTVALGNSMGGFAALLFGRLAGLDLSIAISPQTSIEPADLAAMGETRWWPMLERVHGRATDRRFFDIRNLPQTGSSLVFFGASSTLDRDHAMRLRHERGCRIFSVASSQHEAARAMRDSGLLGRLLDLACDRSVDAAGLAAELRAGGQIKEIAAEPPGRSVRSI